jgi:predicted house-cleaning noncanonical NTP pyrophosphatase (MazG superfamily)
MQQTRQSETFFDEAYVRACAWWNETMAEHFEDHRGAQAQGTLRKIEEEVVEFLRDPCAQEAADVVIALMVWCHIQGINLSEHMLAKMDVNESREWAHHPSGAMRHVDPVTLP